MRFIGSAERASSAKRQRRLPPVKARKVPQIALQRIMIDKSRTPIWYLVCGHSTDYDVQLAYNVWRPKGTNKNYCEQCGRWVAKSPERKPAPIPDEPLF